jgi:hypothetical protein
MYRAIAEPINFLGTIDGELSFKVLIEITGTINRLPISRMPFA